MMHLETGIVHFSFVFCFFSLFDKKVYCSGGFSMVVLWMVVGWIFFFLPKSFLSSIEKWFSFSKKGIRKLRSRKETVDSLGNFFLFLGFLFSILYIFIPNYLYVYVILLTFFCLITLAQAIRVTKRKKKEIRFLVLYGLYLFFAFGILMSFQAGLEPGVLSFKEDLMQGHVFNLFYILTHVSLMEYFLQCILFFIPIYALLAQFKYMRLENMYKASHISIYLFKVFFVCLILYILSQKGQAFLYWFYHLDLKV